MDLIIDSSLISYHGIKCECMQIYSTPSKSSHPSPCGVYEKCSVAACLSSWSLILQVGSTHLSEMALWSAAQMSSTPSPNFPETWQVPSKEPKACYKGAALTLSGVMRQK